MELCLIASSVILSSILKPGFDFFSGSISFWNKFVCLFLVSTDSVYFFCESSLCGRDWLVGVFLRFGFGQVGFQSIWIPFGSVFTVRISSDFVASFFGYLELA